MTINWDAVGALSEFAGAAAVVISVAYLAIQIRQNSKAMRSATRSDIARGQIEYNFRMAENPDMTKALYAFLRGDDINEKERVVAGQALSGISRAFENQYFSHIEGDFSESVWLGYRTNIAWSVQQPGFAKYWDDRRALFSAEFVAFIDELIRQAANDKNSEQQAE
jgi:hypothetical protein